MNARSGSGIPDSIRRIYRDQRAKGVPAARALDIARYEQAPPAYPFLAELSTWRRNGVTGEVDGLAVKVTAEPDPDAQLGEDDVTGWFTDRWEPGCIKNTCRDWSSNYKWYHPSKYDLEELPHDGSTHGMSKSVAVDYIRERIAEAMAEDANRDYWGVSVEVSLDGIELGSASLWNIDSIPGYDIDRYLRDVAGDLIDEALDEARANAPKVAARLTETAAKLAALQDGPS